MTHLDILTTLFGHGKDLAPLQMSMRAIVIFFIGLVLIRIAGRRAFGMKMPFDNVITILLGAVLSRAVVGASPFLSTIAASAAIVILHRLCATLGFYNDAFGNIIKGRKKVLYENGKLHEENMRLCMVTKKDIEEGVRLVSNLHSIEQAKAIYAERDGQISVVKKEED